VTLTKLQLELQDLLGVAVDIATPDAINSRLTEMVMRDRRSI
jgi:predicted nucleotidyltransferase